MARGTRFRWFAVFAVVLFASSAGPVLADPSLEPPGDASQPAIEPSLPDTEDVLRGIAMAEKEEREREEALATPAAIQERVESSEAFSTSDSPTDVAALLASTFSQQLEALNDDPGRFLSDAKLVQPLDETTATVESEGDRQLMDGGMPLRAEEEDGQLRKVDLTLQPVADGYETTNALVEVSVGSSAAEEIEIGADLAISQLGAAPESAAHPFGDENVLFADVETDTDLLVSPIGAGVELFSQLRSVDSPEALHFDLDLPEGAELRADGHGGAEVLKGEEAIAFIPFPHAVDAQGSEVEVQMSVEGNTLTLHVPHREADVAYPLLVDPAIVEDWVNPGTSWANNNNLDALTNGSWQYSESHAWIESGTSCLYTLACWGGGRGLFVGMPSGAHWGAQAGHWVYSAPNPSSYLVNAWASPFWRANQSCNPSQYPEPHDYVGMWYQGKWNRVLINQALVGSVDIQSWGEAFILGLGTGNGSATPCRRDIWVGGAAIWLDDWQHPAVDSVTGQPSGWVNGTTPFTITANVRDEGLGVHRVTIYPEGAPTLEDNVGGCTGGGGKRCPTSYSKGFNLTGASFDQGEKNAYLSAKDPTGKPSNTWQWLMKVDRTPPEVTLGGQLAQETNEAGSEEKPAGEGDELTFPVYNLEIVAKDGSADSPANKRSGVKNIEVFLDESSTPAPVSWEAQSCPESSCGMTEVYPLRLLGLAAGKHTLKVIVEDQVGYKRERKIEFEYFPAGTGMKDEYVMHHFPLPDGQGNEAEEEHPDRPELAVNVMNGNLVYREQDVEVEGSAVDLEVERYYNSQLPTAENTEWGDGWTLAQTPDLQPSDTGGSSEPDEAGLIDSSGAIDEEVELPTTVGNTRFDPALQATITKEADGYEMVEESEGNDDAVVFDSTGQTTELRTSGYARVGYSYLGNSLSEIAVDDPGSVELQSEEIDGAAYLTSFGSPGTANGQFKRPDDLVLDLKRNIWVVDQEDNRVEKFDGNGQFLLSIGGAGSANGQFNSPTAIAVDPEGDVWVLDKGNCRVQQFNEKGEFLSKFGSGGFAAGTFLAPEGLAIDPQGNLWVADATTNRIQKFTPGGEFLKAVGSAGSGPGQFELSGRARRR